MDRNELLSVIIRVMCQISDGRELPADLSEDTRLFGGGAVFDSLGLVTLITEVETEVNDQCGTSIVIASERAMSQHRSPFRTVGALADYVEMLLAEARVDTRQ